MAKIKRGEKLLCVPCGREVTVSFAGIAQTTLWCCGRPMKKSKIKSIKKPLLKRKGHKKS